MADDLRVLHVQDHTIPEMSGYAFRSRYVVETQRPAGSLYLVAAFIAGRGSPFV